MRSAGDRAGIFLEWSTFFLLVTGGGAALAVLLMQAYLRK